MTDKQRIALPAPLWPHKIYFDPQEDEPVEEEPEQPEGEEETPDDATGGDAKEPAGDGGLQYDENGVPVLKSRKGAKEDEPAGEYSVESVFKKGFFAGRFDVKGEDGEVITVTEEMGKENPALGKLVKSYYNAERTIHDMKQGKVKLEEPMGDDDFAGLDWQLGEDGSLNDKTVKTLVGKPITPTMVEFLGDLLNRATATTRKENIEWSERWSNHDALKYKGGIGAAFEFIQDNYSPEEVEEINNALRGRTTRDAVMRDILTKMTGGEIDGGSVGRSMKTGSLSGSGDGSPNPSSGVYPKNAQERQNAYQKDLMKAQNQSSRAKRKAMMQAADAKLTRSYKYYGDEKMVSSGI